MELLDPFSRTFLPAATAAQVPQPMANRHARVLRSCAGSRDDVVLVASCVRTNRRLRRGAPNSLIMITRSRLVVTSETRILRRLRLYLNADVTHLADVTWSPEPDRGALQFAATAVDGIREHFWIRLARADDVVRLDGLLRELFRGAWTAARPVPVSPTAVPALVA
jgi:hypothetical protein